MIAARGLVSDDYPTRLATAKGARQLFLLQRPSFCARSDSGQNPPGWSPRLDARRVFFIPRKSFLLPLLCALPLSPTRCPLAALSRSDRPRLASQAFKAPPTSSPRVPSDSSSLPHLRTARIACCSRDTGSHATHHQKCGQSVISCDPMKPLKFE